MIKPEDKDTDPELFKKSPGQNTPVVCSLCGTHREAGTYEDGKTFVVRRLRKWLATKMPAGEAIAIVTRFVRDELS